MNENIIKLPYKIGSKIFIVEDFNKFYDTDNYIPIRTIYGKDIVIKPMIVEGFIIDKEGIHLAEDGHDGWNRVTTYHDLTLDDKYGDCKIFGSLEEAESFVNKIKK